MKYTQMPIARDGRRSAPPTHSTSLSFADTRATGATLHRNSALQILAVITAIALGSSGFAWLIVKGRRLQRQQHFERQVQARKQGWMYNGQRDGRIDYRFAGSASGIEWSMWYDSDRGDESPTPKAYWQTNNVRAAKLSLVIIGRKRYQMESGVVGRLLMDVVSGVTQAVRGDGVRGRADKAEFYESAVTLEQGRATFRDRYVVAVAPDMPGGWLDDDLQVCLLNWPALKRGTLYRADQRVEVTLGPQGLQIVAQQMPTEFAFWNHLAELGEMLAQRLGRLADR